MSNLLLDTTTNTIKSGSGGITLDPASSEIVTVNNGLLLPDGSKGEPAIRFSDDANTGIYSPIDDVTSIVGHGEDIAQFIGVPSSVNYMEFRSSATGNRIAITANGTDTNVGIDINAKGTGSIHTSSEEFRIQVGAAGQAFVNGYTIIVDDDNISRLTNDSGFITDYTVTEGDVTAHQAALSITESQISDLQSYLTSLGSIGGHSDVDLTGIASNDLLQWNGSSFVKFTPNYLTSESNDLSASVTWINVPDANITQSSVTQHQAALSITESQISDLGSYLTNITGESIGDLSNVDLTGLASGKILEYNGSNFVLIDTPSGGGSGIDNVVEDTTPQLGGDFDVNGNSLVSTSNGDINITPNGTGNVSLGNFTFDADQTVGSGQDNYVLTYDDASGTISLEEASGGGGGGATELDDLSDVSTQASVGAHRYWRILYNSNDDGTSCRLAEIEWKDVASGSDLATTQTNAISSSTASAFWDDQYVYADDGTSRNWLNNGVEAVSDAYIGYDFGAGNEKAIVEMTIQSSTAPTQAPSAFQVQYSDDNSSWTTVDTFTGQTWTSGEIKTFTISTGSSAGKGDILVHDGTEFVTLAPGSNDQALVVDSNETTGVKWGSVSASDDYISHTYDGTAASSSGNKSLCIGDLSTSGVEGISIGSQITGGDGTRQVSIGYYMPGNDSDRSVHIGYFVRANDAGSTDNVLIGSSANSNAACDYAVGIGGSVQVRADETIAIGKSAASRKQHDIVIGSAATSSNDTGSQNEVNVGYSSGNTNYVADGCVHVGPYMNTNVPTSAQFGTATAAGVNEQYLLIRDSGNLTLTGSAAQYVLPTYTVATLPTGTEGGMIYVSDGDAGSKCLAVYDGSNWKVVSLGATVSAS